MAALNKVVHRNTVESKTLQSLLSIQKA